MPKRSGFGAKFKVLKAKTACNGFCMMTDAVVPDAEYDPDCPKYCAQVVPSFNGVCQSDEFCNTMCKNDKVWSEGGIRGCAWTCKASCKFYSMFRVATKLSSAVALG